MPNSRTRSLVLLSALLSANCCAGWGQVAHPSESPGRVQQSPALTEVTAANSGSLELKELKPTATVDVKASQSRVFRTSRKIKRVAVSDPSIAEAVVVSEREVILVGKAPGRVTLSIWCEGAKP